MGLLNLTGLVLRTRPWQEQDKLVTLYTRERGKVLAMARGGRKPSSSWGASLEPFTVLDLQVYQKADRLVITQCRIQVSHVQLRCDLQFSIAGLYLLELVDEFARDEDANPQLFRELAQALTTLEGSHQPETIIDTFTLKLLSLLGFWPSLENCTSCGKPVQGTVIRFQPAAGGVVCGDCQKWGGGTLAIRSSTLERARWLLQTPWSELSPDSGTFPELSELLRIFLAAHLEKGYSPVLAFRARIGQP